MSVPVALSLVGVAGAASFGFARIIDKAWRGVTVHDDTTSLLEGRKVSHGEWDRSEHRLTPTARGGWPKGPQVYAHFNDRGECVYIGKATSLRHRFASHAKTERAFADGWSSWKSWSCETRSVMNRLEPVLIRMHTPRGNEVLYKSTPIVRRIR
jgi:hypothetical protein